MHVGGGSRLTCCTQVVSEGDSLYTSIAPVPRGLPPSTTNEAVPGIHFVSYGVNVTLALKCSMIEGASVVYIDIFATTKVLDR